MFNSLGGAVMTIIHPEPHRPKHTHLYKLVKVHYPVLAEQMAAQGTHQPLRLPPE